MDSDTSRPLDVDDVLRDLAWLQRLARSLTDDEDAADDIVQETLIAATSQPRPLGALRGWLRGIARNLHRERIRAETRRTIRERLSSPGEEPQTPAQLVERAEVQSALARFVVGMDEPYRTTVLLHYFEGLTSAEIGARMGVPPATVRWRLAAALRDLRSQLDRWSGGNRRRWALLFGLPGSRVTGSVLRGVVMAKAGTKTVALVAMLLAMIGGGLIVMRARTHSTTAPMAAQQKRRPRGAPLASGTAPAPLPVVKVVEDSTGPFRIVEGRVRSLTDGSAIGGAAVGFLCDGVESSVAADPQGRFELKLKDPVQCELSSAEAAGYSKYSAEPGHSERVFDLRSATHLAGIEVFLETVRHYFGKVVDPKGQPVAGAKVTFVLSDGSSPGTPAVGTQWTTDERGTFELDGTPRMWMEATHPQFAPGRMFTGGGTGFDRHFEIKLSERPAGSTGIQTIDGMVIAPNGTPLPDVLITAVYMLPEGSKAYGQLPQQAVSSPTGTFHLGGLDPGRWSLRAEAESYAVARTAVDAGARDIRMVLPKGGSIAGSVRDEAGKPVAAFTVVAQKRLGAVERGEDGASRSFYSSSGRYQLDHLPSAQYSVVVGAAGFAQSKEVAVDVRDGASSTADLVVATGGTVSGQAADVSTHKPITGAWVQFSSTVELPLTTGVLTDQDGRFVLTGIPSGWFSVTAIDENHMGRIVDHLKVSPGDTLGPINIELRPLRPGENSNIQMVGIGITMKAAGDNIVLTGIVPGGGAAEAGLTVGDVLLSVDGTPISSLGFTEAAAMIRGSEDTTVKLGVKRGESSVALVEVRRKMVVH